MKKNAAEKKKTMVGYGRVSTDEERQLDSLQHQVEFFSEFAASHNYELVSVYADEGITGRQLRKRDQFLKMMADAEKKQFDVVVVKDVSRFARNTVDLLTSIRRLRSIGINILFVNNNQQTLGESEFVITLLGAMAQEESANLSKRVRFGKTITAKKGRVPNAVLGYDKVDNYTLKINEEEARLVKRIYSMYLNGEGGMAHIAAVLRGEGILTRKGCAYTEGYIRRVLTNPIYCGTLVNHRSETVDFINGVRAALPEEKQFKHERPELTIVSKEDFDAVQRIRAERCRIQMNGGVDPRRRYTNRYLFSGLVRCAECGRTMFRQNNFRANGKVDSYWRCPSGSKMTNDHRCTNHVYVRDDQLVEALSKSLDQFLKDREHFAVTLQSQFQKQSQEDIDQKAAIADCLQRKEKLIKQKDKYMKMFFNDVISIDELKRYNAGVLKQIEGIDYSIGQIRDQKESAQQACVSIHACITEIENFVALKDIMNGDVRRFLSHVEVSSDRGIVFVFKTDPCSNIIS